MEDGRCAGAVSRGKMWWLRVYALDPDCMGYLHLGSAMYQLCDLVQVTQALCASSVGWDKNNYPIELL